MNRYEFIEKLRVALSGKATQSAINENIRYYEEYLDAEIRKGKNEAEVLRELGDPRLLAKTIIEANKQAGQGGNYQEVYHDTVDYGEEQTKRKTHLHVNGKEVMISKWAVILVLVLIAVIIISLIGVVLRILLPIVIPFVLILMAVKIISVLIDKG